MADHPEAPVNIEPHTDSHKDQKKEEAVAPKVIQAADNTATGPQNIVHLDLKGAPPKVKYLEQVGIDLCKQDATSEVYENEVMVWRLRLLACSFIDVSFILNFGC